MKINRILEWILFGLSFVFALLIVCPVNGTLLGFEVIFGNYLLAMAFFLPMIAGVLLVFKARLHLLGSFALILYGLYSIILISQIGETLSATPAVIIFSVLAILMILVLLYILNGENEYSIRDIVESAMLIAMAIGLDLPGLKIRIGVNGGSISFTMVPLFILALRLGTLKGFIGCGVIYGTITCVLDGWGFYSFPFDYLLGYGAITAVSLFRKQIINDEAKFTVKGVVFLVAGVVIAIALRLLAATLSGMIYYETPFIESLSYNASYVLPSGGICVVVLLLLYKPFLVVNKKFPTK